MGTQQESDIAQIKMRKYMGDLWSPPTSEMLEFLDYFRSASEASGLPLTQGIINVGRWLGERTQKQIERENG